MTISSTNRKAGPYAGNDVAVSFPFAFKVFAASDLYVVRADSDGAETVLALTANYTVTLNADQNANPGGTITLPAALADGLTLTITSTLPYLQPVDLTNNGGFYPKVINSALDRLTIFVQQIASEIGASLKLGSNDAPGSGAYRAGGNRIADVGNPTSPGDAVNRGWIDLAITGVNTYTNSLYSQARSYAESLVSGVVGGYGYFVQLGAGAISRTFQDKMRESVSVFDFGAVGDGVTDDTAAIQAAINELPAGGTLDGLGLTYVVKASNLKSNMTLQNFNFITKAGAVPADYWSPVTIGSNGDTSLRANIIVRNVHVNGNRLNNMTGSVVYAEDGGKHGFRLIGNINNVLLENCSAQYCGSYGFFGYRGLNTTTIPFDDVATITNLRIVNCVSRYNKAHGCAFDAVQHLRVENCVFTHNGLAHGADPAGMTLGGNAYGSGIDFEGYGIGSYIGDIDVVDTDLRHNGAKSILVTDPVDTSDPRFVIRNAINFTDCLMDTGSEATRFDPTVALQITAPFANWANGSIYKNVVVQGGRIDGEIWFACVDDMVLNPIQIVVTGTLGAANYCNRVTCQTPITYSFSGSLNDITYKRLVTYETGNWTPIISSGSGTITSYTSSGTWTKVERQVTLTIKYGITNNGTGASYGLINNLPFTADANGGSASTRIGGTTGLQCAVTVDPSTTTANIWQYDNTYPWASGASGNITIVYQVGV